MIQTHADSITHSQFKPTPIQHPNHQTHLKNRKKKNHQWANPPPLVWEIEKKKSHCRSTLSEREWCLIWKSKVWEREKIENGRQERDEIEILSLRFFCLDWLCCIFWLIWYYEALGFDDIAGFEKMVILRFLIFGFVFLDLRLSSCLRHSLISIYVVFSF